MPHVRRGRWPWRSAFSSVDSLWCTAARSFPHSGHRWSSRKVCRRAGGLRALETTGAWPTGRGSGAGSTGGGVVDRRGSAGDYEQPSAKVGHQITPAVLIELQPLQNRLRRGRELRAEQRLDGVRDPALLPLRQLAVGPTQQLQIITPATSPENPYRCNGCPSC